VVANFLLNCLNGSKPSVLDGFENELGIVLDVKSDVRVGLVVFEVW